MNTAFRYQLFTLVAFLLLAGCPNSSQSPANGPVERKSEASLPPTELGSVVLWVDPALRGAMEAIVSSPVAIGAKAWQITYRESGELPAVSGNEAPDLILATEPVIKKLLSNDSIDASTARTFAGDLLVLATPASKPIVVPKVGDLPIVKLDAFGLGGPDTAVGFYAEQAMISDGVLDDLKAVTQRFENTAELLAALESGRVQLAMLFGSSVAQRQDLRISATVPENLHMDIRYQAVATRKAATRKEVQGALVLLSENSEVQQLLGAFGYLDRATAMLETR